MKIQTQDLFGVQNANFPGGSKSKVNKAGDRVRLGLQTADDLAVIDTWRAAHRAVLNTFQAILRNRTRSTHVNVAQRHKTKRTIFDKLNRLPKMELSRMDDIAGCRLIFPKFPRMPRPLVAGMNGPTLRQARCLLQS